MSGADRFGEKDHESERSARTPNLTWLSEPTTWFAVAIAGMLVVFGGLAVDAYRHNDSAVEESLLSLGNPGHLLAAIGLVVTSVAVLTGLTIAALNGASTAERAIRRGVPVTLAWVALTTFAVGSITYIGASGTTVGHNQGAETAAQAAQGHDATGADTTGIEAASVSQALADQGIATDGAGTDVAAANVPGALTQGSNGKAGGQHDKGQQPTFTQLTTMSQDQLLPLFPANTISATDFPAFKTQVEQVRTVAERFGTPALAAAGGYVKTTTDVPYMGEHYLNYDYVKTGKFDPLKPQGLLFSKIDGGEQKLVGVWFLLIPGIGGNTRDAEPAGFTGDLDLWHAHTGLCLGGKSGASEGQTKEACVASGGNFTADLRWMMHVWVTPETTENPQGVFAYLNSDLFSKQQAAAKAASNPSGLTQ